MPNGLLEYVVALIAYKIKVPPWCAVLREAWRTLLMQMYDFFLIHQNFSIIEHSPEGIEFERQFIISPGCSHIRALQAETCPAPCISPNRKEEKTVRS